MPALIRMTLSAAPIYRGMHSVCGVGVWSWHHDGLCRWLCRWLGTVGLSAVDFGRVFKGCLFIYLGQSATALSLGPQFFHVGMRINRPNLMAVIGCE